MDILNIKRESSGEKILSYLDNNKSAVIFGAGSIGSQIKDALDKFNVKVHSFLVNDGQKDKEEHNGIRIYELSEFPLKQSECNILYCIQSDSQAILQPLIKTMKTNILYIDGTKAIFSLLNKYYTQYFKKHNICISREIMDLGELKIINPFTSNEEYLNSFLFEVGDLILPEIMKDLTSINEGPYEDGEVVLKEDDIVFDCGANIGLFSSIAASKGCICYAFEPDPKTREFLKNTAKLYPELIKVCSYALSDCNGKTKFYISNDTNLSNSITGINLEKDNYIEVEMKTIDEYVKENNISRVDFIKADIEGAERLMVMGAKETLKRFSPKISICTYHLEDDKQVLEELIKKANPNYIVEHKWKKLYAYIP